MNEDILVNRVLKKLPDYMKKTEDSELVKIVRAIVSELKNYIDLKKF